MPVSVVCESSANVNGALRESLGVNCSADDVKSATASNNSDGLDCLSNKVIVSAKRVLLSKVDYEEVSNYSHSVLQSLKSKYIVLKQAAATIGTNNTEHGRASPATCNRNGGNIRNNAADGNGNPPNNNTAANTSSNSNNTAVSAAHNAAPVGSEDSEMPRPRHVLFPRENVLIGWTHPTHNWQIGVGLLNTGNTCYLNATLQALFHVPSLANWLLSDTEHMYDCDNTDSSCIICAMAKTLYACQSNSSAVRPYYINSKLKSICRHFIAGRQEDAHEFLRYLIEAMEKAYLTRFRNYRDLDPYSKETTPLNQIFGGYLKSTVRCINCGHVSVSFQHFQDLLLDIRKVDILEEALDGYFSQERLEDISYKCESCKKKVSATKHFSIERAPIALCIQLKRFNMSGGKITKPVAIKQRLNLSKYSSRKNPEPPFVYKLVSMITHLGSSQHCGHYIAIGLTESGVYYSFDDSYVRPATAQSVCNTNAYMIFYELDTTPPRSQSHTEIGVATTNDYIQDINGHDGNNSHSASPKNTIESQLSLASIRNNASAGIANRISPTNGTDEPINGSNRNESPLGSEAAKLLVSIKNNIIGLTNSSVCSSSTDAGVSTNYTKAQFQNGTHKNRSGTGQGCPMVSSQRDNQTRSTSNGYENNRSEYESEVSSSTHHLDQNEVPTDYCNSSNSILPSMPSLFEASSPAFQTKVVASAKLSLSIESPAKPGSKQPPKSLVPYDDESDDEPITTENKPNKFPPRVEFIKHAAKRRNSSSPIHDKADHGFKPSFLTKIKKTGAHAKIIDEIFKSNQLVNTTFKPINKENSSFQLSTITPSSSSTADLDVNGALRNALNIHVDRPLFNRSQSTPPSSGLTSQVIESKTGLWEVTALKPGVANGPAVLSSDEAALKATKNPKNPFAVKSPTPSNAHGPADLSAKRPKCNTERPMKWSPITVGDASQCDANNASNGSTEHLKHSSLGYGSVVQNWDGGNASIEKEIAKEVYEQRQREWVNAEDNEMDRGHQKKIKTYKETPTINRNSGYNVFQEEENQRRWRQGAYRYYGGHFRHQFQRNRFKFQRNNPRFHRGYQHGNISVVFNRRDS